MNILWHKSAHLSRLLHRNPIIHEQPEREAGNTLFQSAILAIELPQKERNNAACPALKRMRRFHFCLSSFQYLPSVYKQTASLIDFEMTLHKRLKSLPGGECSMSLSFFCVKSGVEIVFSLIAAIEMPAAIWIKRWMKFVGLVSLLKNKA